MPKVRGIKVAPIKSVKGFKRRKRSDKLTPPKYKERKKEEKETRETAIYNQIGAHSGDEKVAKNVVRLEAEYPRSTVPELVVYDWLEKKGHDFWYQTRELGGRSRGGLIPDFVISSGGKGIAWLVQGSYYHGSSFQSMAGQVGRDAAAEMKLVGQYVGGVRIEMVIPLKEKDIYDRRPQIFLQAMNGQRL